MVGVPYLMCSWDIPGLVSCAFSPIPIFPLSIHRIFLFTATSTPSMRMHCAAIIYVAWGPGARGKSIAIWHCVAISADQKPVNHSQALKTGFYQKMAGCNYNATSVYDTSILVWIMIVGRSVGLTCILPLLLSVCQWHGVHSAPRSAQHVKGFRSAEHVIIIGTDGLGESINHCHAWMPGRALETAWINCARELG